MDVAPVVPDGDDAEVLDGGLGAVTRAAGDAELNLGRWLTGANQGRILSTSGDGLAMGRLIAGPQHRSAIGTLVERTTGYVMLLHLPDGRGACEVQRATVEIMSSLPRTLRRSLTWVQGRELTNHGQIAAATGMDIYFCDPHSPWQRGTILEDAG